MTESVPFDADADRPARPLSSPRALIGLSTLALGLAIGYRSLRRRRYSFAGRTAIVTGGSRGLGLELARQLCAQGARVWLVARSADALETAAAALREQGGSVEFIPADIRRPAAVRQIVDIVVRTDRRLDILVNNAGIITVAPFEQSRHDDFENSLATHFWGPLELIRAALPYLGRDGDGRIVNISSIGGRVGVPHLAAYAAGKFALTGLSETLRAELGQRGIYVTTVTPGLMRTGSYVNVELRGDHEREFRWFTAMSATPLTSMRTDRAAAEILRAVRDRRATVTPGVPARVASLINGLAPNRFAAATTLANKALPDAGDGDDGVRRGTEVDPGPIKPLLSEDTRHRFHQPDPAWR
jgi:NAD(P)-dependent dehydrogenase (short-subunit alcohol dehydrogenase family)